MNLLASLRAAITHSSLTCDRCVYFCTDTPRFEAALPGVAALSSGHASVRAGDGLCGLENRLINGRRRCSAFAERDVQTRVEGHRNPAYLRVARPRLRNKG